MKKTLFFAIRASITFMAAMTVLFFVSSGFFIRLFMKNPTIVAYGSRFLKGLCLALPFLCMDFLAVGVFQACGMGKRSLIFALLRKIVLEIPALYIWNYLYPLYGLAYAQFTAEFVLAAAAVIVLLRIFQNLEKETKNRNQG